MGRLTWVDSGIWYDIRKMDVQMQNLYLRLLINDDGNIAGYYKLKSELLAFSMDLEEEQLLEMLDRPTKYWKYDAGTEQILIPKYTKYNVVNGPKQLAKLNAELKKLTPCWLHGEFIKAWGECNGIGAEELLDPKFIEAASAYIHPL